VLSFLHDLVTYGRVVVSPTPESTSVPSPELENAIRELDQVARLELGHTPPALHLPTALWALGIIENACRFLVYRQYEPQVISEVLHAPAPDVPGASGIYSADLLLRHLPEIERMARGIGESDPLVEVLRRLGQRWPLSSVGMPDVACEAADLVPIFSDPCLCQLYIDRIIERADLARLDSPRVRDAVCTALGAYPSLAPDVSDAIKRLEERA
jgi:hypothetical protein